MIVYLLVRRVLGLAVPVFRRDLAKDAGLLVLRHDDVYTLALVWQPSPNPAVKVFLWHCRLAFATG